VLRTLHHSRYPPERIAAERQVTVSVCLPARDEATTIGPILQALLPLRDAGAVDEVVVVDDSRDSTAEIAARLGATVHAQRDLRPELGPVLGKGDAMWRALSALTGDVVCFLDADSSSFGAHFACGLVGAVVCEPNVQLAKGFYRRPFRTPGSTLPTGGGRVTELTARPLLELFYPALAAFRQPLAGEVAARRSLLERLPFTTGYGVDVALLIDAWHAVGIDALAQVDLDVRQNAHQPLADLGPMAAAVLRAVTERLIREGRLEPEAVAGPAAPERPPVATLSAAA